MGYDYKVCFQKLTKEGLTPCDGQSNPYHCESFETTDAYHNSCANESVYMPVQALMCKNYNTGDIKVFPSQDLITECTKLHDQNSAWNFYQCYCCCSCFAYDTPIEAPEGPIKVQDIDEGSEVLAGSLKQAGKTELVWQPARIHFSRGTNSSEQPAMVYIVYGDKKEIIVTPDHVFMLSSGKFTTASKLKRGDQLVDKDGKPVAILTASIGHYKGGVHHISTSKNFEGSVDNHLVISGGIVSGDYTLQIHFEGLDKSFKVDDYAERNAIGSKEHLQENKDLMKAKGVFYLAPDAEEIFMSNDSFKAYSLEHQDVPYGAKALFTDAQAMDIFNNGNQYPLHVTVGLGGAQYLIKLFKGFYPDLNIVLEWERFDPNIYAFKEYEQNFVLVSGGLVRMDGLEIEGLALLIGHGIARFYGGEPKSMDGFSCTGTADFYSAAAISRKIWFGDQWMNLVLNGYNQITALFGLISAENGKGNPLNICGEPSVACRLQAIQSGIAGGNLPACAGGPEKPMLALEMASATTDGIALTFNLGVDRSSAGDTASYILNPAAEIKQASLDPKKNFIVNLTVSLEKGKEYTINVKNLLSMYATELDPSMTSYTFTVD